MVLKKWMMPNGLWVSCCEMPDSSLAAVYVYVLGGARVEKDPEAGLAHFLEHLLFRGSPKYPNEKAVTDFIAKRGGETNAFTSHENIAIYVETFKEFGEEACDILSDVLFKSFFAEEAIALERGAVFQEINNSLDDPDADIGRVFSKLIWGEHPLGREILGDEAKVKSFTRESFLDYHSQYFYPANMSLAVAGGLRAEEVFDLAFKYFYEAPQRRERVRFNDALSPGEARTSIVDKDFNQARCILGSLPQDWITFKKEHAKDRIASYVLMKILGGGLGSRLYDSVRSKRGLAYTVYSYLSVYQDCGSFEVFLGTDADKASEAIRVVKQEFANMLKDGVTDEEIEKTKNAIRHDYAKRAGDEGGIAADIASEGLKDSEIMSYADYFQTHIQPIQKDDIMGVARRIFAPDGLRLAVTGKIEKYSQDLQDALN